MTGDSATLKFDAQHSVSVPTKVIWHAISDEELEMLIEGGKDSSLEWGLATLGGFLGSAPTLWKVISEYNSKGAGNIAGFDMFQAALAIGLATAAFVCIRYHLKNQKRMGQIEARIRARRTLEPEVTA